MAIAIIGGGIGGLTTALALKQAGISFTLYEAAPEIKSVGAGIIMASNALQVFRHFGIHEAICRKGNRIDAMHITRADFSTLSRIALSVFETRYGLQNHAIHRADLHRLIADAVGDEHITLNKRLHRITKIENEYQLDFEDGSTCYAPYVIGADGIRSQVRQQLFPENVYRDAQQVCWRGVTRFTLPEHYRHEALEAWHKGKRIGFVQLDKDNVYWYLVINAAMEIPDAEVSRYIKDFNPLVKELVQATPAETLIRGPLYDLKPVHDWYRDGVCLVGDAAHAVTPNLGQGACQAVEDAYVLGALLQRHEPAVAFAKYPEARRAKAHYIARASRQLGIVSHFTNPVAIAIRNFTLKYLTPEKVNLKQMNRLFRLPDLH